MTDAPTLDCPRPTGLGGYVNAFESACAAAWPADLTRFLPPPGHPDYLPALCELIRVDLEFGWERGTPKPLAEYRAAFPALFARPDLAASVEFENRRLRGQAEGAAAADGDEFGPATAVVAASPVAAEELEELARAVYAGDGSVGPGTAVLSVASGVVERLRAVSPEAASQLDRAAALPKVGTEFLGFRLEEELGAGSFGRVFLARQQALSDRPVALKVTARPNREAQHLARLQHTNIVPVLSVHTAGPVQAVCMPYFGRTTLGHVLGTIRQHPTLPASGHGLVSTLKGAAADTVPEKSAPAPKDAAPAPRPLPPLAGRAPARELLNGMGYADAVAWLGARLADGLAHAHERGVLHRDLKPDNVLLSDDGQPMLLDFNLADDTTSGAAAAVVGGTVLYMAPEHMAAFAGHRTRPVDARSDLYALGLMLYELLTGRHPFPVPKVESGILDAMRAARRRPPVPVRRLNPAVSPAVAAVVARLLDPDPDCRYQTARELQEDLDRHLAHLPLKHTREPSFRERVRKWRQRNPRAVPFIGLAAAVLLAAGVGAVAVANVRAQGRTEAAARRAAFKNDLQYAEVMIGANAADAAVRDAGAERLRAALDGYAAVENPDWQGGRLVRRLDPAQRDDLRSDVGEALILLARATAPFGSDPAKAEEALELNRRAEACFPAGAAPAALMRQRDELSARLGRPAELRPAAAGPPKTARDAYLEGADAAAAAKWAEAIPALERACRLDPQHLAATFTLGACYDAVGRDAEALECYRACIALRPEFPAPYLNRGIVYLRRGDVPRARADLDDAVRLGPDWAAAYFTRGTLRQKAGELREALADFDRAEALRAPKARLFLLRAQVKAKLGDAAGAAKDRAAGFAGPASDDLDYLARGVAHLPADPAAALAEFDKALALNPRSLAGFQNRSHVLAEHLNRGTDAVAALDEAVKLYPAFVPARAGRAVLLARLGKRAEAHKDATDCLRRDAGPATLYQLAGVYALTSNEHPDDRREALRLLSAALTAGFRDFATLDRDPDLKPLRGLPEFSALMSEFRPPAADPKK